MEKISDSLSAGEVDRILQAWNGVGLE